MGNRRTAPQSPIPVNKPLDWQKTGKPIRMEATITPNAPGANDFRIHVWLPGDSKEPKGIRLILKYTDNKEVAPIEIPLVPEREAEKDRHSLIHGYLDYIYTGEGSYIPFPGTWNVEVHIMDANDQETIYRKEQIIYLRCHVIVRGVKTNEKMGYGPDLFHAIDDVYVGLVSLALSIRKRVK